MWWNKKAEPEIIANQKRYSILMVEDNISNHELFYEIFGSAGFDVVIRQTADGDFIDEVAKLAPDIISMDIMISKDGGDAKREGLEAAELLKSDERTKHIPLMMLTNFTDEQKILRAKELGAVDFVGLQSHVIREIPYIFLRYLEDPAAYIPTHPYMRNQPTT